MATLLSFGEALIDFLPQDQNNSCYQPICGGAPANVAVAYAKLGGQSFFAGGLSDDNFGQLIKQQFLQYGVKDNYIVNIKQSSTALVLVSLDDQGEREFSLYRHNSADMYFQNSDFDAIDWSKIDCVHFCSNTLTNIDLANVTNYGLNIAKTEQKLISFDVNLRYSLWEEISQLAKRVEQCFTFVDILKFSKEEIDYLAQQKNCDYSAYLTFCLEQGVSLILITDGAKPIHFVTQKNWSFFQPPTISPLDTTAAGDSFIAAFLYVMAKKGKPEQWLNAALSTESLVNALKFSSQCSAITCGKKGAFPAFPTKDELSFT